MHAGMLRIFHHAYDREWLIGLADCERLSECPLRGSEKRAHKTIVHDDDLARSGTVSVGENTACQQGKP